MMNMKAGDSCTYRIQAACGAPGFQIDSSLDPATYEVTYVEWNSQTVGMPFASTLSTPIVDRAASAPAMGYPPRNFVYSYFSTIVADTAGFTGNYDQYKGGNMIYGNSVQGVSLGFSNANLGGCSDRNILVTVTALTDQNLNYINLNAASYKLIEGMNGSFGLQLATASLAGLVAASLF